MAHLGNVLPPRIPRNPVEHKKAYVLKLLEMQKAKQQKEK